MAVLLLIILLVVIIPLAEGVLLAFLLREIYNKHPLPLGGTIGKREPPQPKVRIVEEDVAEEAEEEVSEVDSPPEDPAEEENEPEEAPDEEPQAKPSPEKDDEDASLTGPDGLPVSDVLAEMMAEIEAAIPGDLERTIEEASLSPDALLPKMQALDEEQQEKEQYDEDLQALADTLQEEKIDLAEEFDGFDGDAEDSGAISSLAKDVLGEDFDFDSLTKQPLEQSESSADKPDSEGVGESDEPNYAGLPDIPDVFDDLPETMPDLSDAASEPLDASDDLPETMPDLSDAASEPPDVSDDLPDMMPDLSDAASELPDISADLPEIAADLSDETAEPPEIISEQSGEAEYAELPELEIFEDESGTVQVSSPFISSVIPQLADFSAPQTIVPTFSSDWIQESASVLEPFEGDVSQFCYTEESRPMFVRRKGGPR